MKYDIIEEQLRGAILAARGKSKEPRMQGGVFWLGGDQQEP
jgi:hypothetical protein